MKFSWYPAHPRQCFCGTEAEFTAAQASDQCGATEDDSCSGDSTAVCGGKDSLSIYRRRARLVTPAPAFVPSPTAAPLPPVSATPAPVSPVRETGAPVTTPLYQPEGCYEDDIHDRTFNQLPVLVKKTMKDGMNIEVWDNYNKKSVASVKCGNRCGRYAQHCFPLYCSGAKRLTIRCLWC